MEIVVFFSIVSFSLCAFTEPKEKECNLKNYKTDVLIHKSNFQKTHHLPIVSLMIMTMYDKCLFLRNTTPPTEHINVLYFQYVIEQIFFFLLL